MRQYAVIVILESTRARHYTLSSLPLHLTILSLFFSDKQPLFFRDRLGKITDNAHRFTVTTTGRGLFGVNKDIPVTLLRKNNTLDKLHHRLLEAVSGHVSFRAPQFVGDGYGPHITDQAGREVSGNIDLPVEKLTLVEVVDQNVYVRSDHLLRAET